MHNCSVSDEAESCRTQKHHDKKGAVEMFLKMDKDPGGGDSGSDEFLGGPRWICL